MLTMPQNTVEAVVSATHDSLNKVGGCIRINGMESRLASKPNTRVLENTSAEVRGSFGSSSIVQRNAGAESYSARSAIKGLAVMQVLGGDER